MNILDAGAQILQEQLGLNVDTQTVQSALSALLGDGQGNIDIAALASQFAASGGLADMVNSWLGDGGNAPLSTDTVMDVLGRGNVNDFASRLGTDAGSAAGGLAEMIPGLIDQASSGGSLLESAGGLFGAARSLF